MDKRITIMKHLYMGDSVSSERKASRIRDLLAEDAEHSGVYLLVLLQDDAEQLSILEASELSKEYYLRKFPMIAGFAASEKEAVAVVQKLLAETYKAKGNGDMRAYLLMREEYAR